MSQHLSELAGGFAVQSLGSQKVFRAALQALSHPGTPVPLRPDAELPGPPGHAAAAGLLLALLDADCTLWLSPRLRAGQSARWLRFHTGCHIVGAAAQAQFLWVGAGDAMPALASLRQGSDTDPDQSATCVLEVDALSASAAAAAPATALVLSGPGIRHQTRLSVSGLPAAFLAQWADNQASFPCGVDCFLASAELLVGLPRSTLITTPSET